VLEIVPVVTVLAVYRMRCSTPAARPSEMISQVCPPELLKSVTAGGVSGSNTKPGAPEPDQLAP